MVNVGEISLNSPLYEKNISNVAMRASAPAFNAQAPNIQTNNMQPQNPASQVQLATSLRSSEEQKMFTYISAKLDPKYKQALNYLLKSGVLLSANSNDKSTVLDNLHKILTTPRLEGLNSENIVREVIASILNPASITQKAGDIPEKIIKDIVIKSRTIPGGAINPQDISTKSGSCVAASIEFDLAQKMPAEFARFAQELSSPKISVTKKFPLKALSDREDSSIMLLNEFKMPYKMLNYDNAEVELKPDSSALVRARVQAHFRDKGERSVIDVLIQSTLMNSATCNTYNSLTDKRAPKFNDSTMGLAEIEKTFIENIVKGKQKISATYQTIDEKGALIGYECDFNTMYKHIANTIKKGENVIIGFTFLDKNNIHVGGHEITIIGIEKAPDGKLYFVCNDTDDGKDNLIKYAVKDMLPRIHHAGVIKEALTPDVEIGVSWKEAFDDNKKIALEQLKKSGEI